MTILAVVGPTAVGKSAVALEVARQISDEGRGDIEIVAVDAFTVYRHMDVGTAKPSPQQRAQFPHHLVDILEPSQTLTAATFQQLARRAIAEIQQRGATPLLVGGSGLYWRAVVDDLNFPPTDGAVRAALQAQWASDVAAAHQHLAGLDPAAAAAIPAGNLRRIVRALEVITLTDRPFSSYRTAFDHYDSVYPALSAVLIDPDDTSLRAAIDERARRMVAEGLVDEASRLNEAGMSVTARQAIGYAEAFAVLSGRLASDELADTVARRTWRYARRQRTWFRKDPRLTTTTSDAGVQHLVDTALAAAR